MCNNKSAINIAHDLIYHERIKHVDIDHFCIKEKFEEKLIHINHFISVGR